MYLSNLNEDEPMRWVLVYWNRNIYEKKSDTKLILPKFYVYSLITRLLS